MYTHNKCQGYLELRVLPTAKAVIEDVGPQSENPKTLKAK